MEHGSWFSTFLPGFFHKVQELLGHHGGAPFNENGETWGLLGTPHSIEANPGHGAEAFIHVFFVLILLGIPFFTYIVYPFMGKFFEPTPLRKIGIGLVLTAALYLLPIAPLGLALGRARLEWEAYAETLRAHAEVYGVEAAQAPELHAYIERQFPSAAYGWMWPFRGQVRGWIDAEVERIVEKSAT